ncbi:alanine racemase [Heliobacterium mobile]|uniref:alanine racemase n=1 Tax=Heliobacterium mobile TaxID=28064 RepID=UPI001F17002A|nr:alanine racemase [Heliobacterium mobile]
MEVELPSYSELQPFFESQTPFYSKNYPLDGRPAWSEINLKAFVHNLRVLRQVTRRESKFLAVIKADAYGHGALPLARAAVQEGVDGFVVAILDEGIHLRQGGIDVPILILGYTPPAACEQVVQYDLSQTVYSLPVAEALSQAARRLGKKARVHLKVETGMGRVGFYGEEAIRNMLAVARLPGIEVEGIFSHFATADEKDKSFAQRQLEQFLETVERLRQAGLEIPLRHMANSAGIIDLPESHLEAVRAGISLYGYYPSGEVNREQVSLLPVMTLKARIVQVKEVPAGMPVSYGCTYRCPRPTRIATVPLGYADGIPRVLSGRIQLYGRGGTFPQVGRVCMDHIMADIGESPLTEGDEVVLFGRWMEGSEWRQASVEDWSQKLGTISYEILCGISPRIPRCYIP